MRRMNVTPESGQITINGSRMSWVMKRSKGESIFGIHGSRIFELELKKDGKTTGIYEKGWTKPISNEDEASILCLRYLTDKFGKEKAKKKKEDVFCD